jgi:hypothetical protein
MNEEVDIQDREAREAAAKAADYEHGWSSAIDTEFAPKGLNEDTVRFISAKKGEPEWMLEWRLKAFRLWQEMEEPDWAKVGYPKIDYQDAFYYAAPKKKPTLKSLDELDPEIREVYQKLGIPIEEQKVLAGVEGARKVAVDAVFDSVSVATTFREELKKAGVIFLSISEAIREHPELVKKWLGRVVPQRDNFFATLNSAVFSDGTFVYIPEGVRCPMELSTYIHRPVRAHADHCREGQLRLLPRRLHGADARREPASRRGGRAGRAGRCRDQVFDRAELVPRRCRGRGRDLQLRHQTRVMPGRALEDFLDAGRDRQRDHLEVPELRTQRRGLGGRVLLGSGHQQPPTGRHRHQDDPQRTRYALDDHL